MTAWILTFVLVATFIATAALLLMAKDAVFIVTSDDDPLTAEDWAAIHSKTADARRGLTTTTAQSTHGQDQ